MSGPAKCIKCKHSMMFHVDGKCFYPKCLECEEKTIK